MIKNIRIGNKIYKISADHRDFFKDDFVKQCISEIVQIPRITMSGVEYK